MIEAFEKLIPDFQMHEEIYKNVVQVAYGIKDENFILSSSVSGFSIKASLLSLWCGGRYCEALANQDADLEFLNGFNGNFVPIRLDWTGSKDISQCNLKLDFLPSKFLSRSDNWDETFSFDDAYKSDYNGHVGRVETSCSMAVLSLFSSLLAVSQKDHDDTLLVGRCSAHPRVNCRPFVDISRLYNESAKKEESGLIAAFLGMKRGSSVLEQPLTGFAYSVKTCQTKSDYDVSVQPSIQIQAHQSQEVDCRQLMHVEYDDLRKLCDVLFLNASQALDRYADWSSKNELTETTGLGYLQLLSHILSEFNNAYHGLRDVSDWQALWFNLMKKVVGPGEQLHFPSTFPELYQQVRVMLNYSTNVRLGWLDGCGRMTTACYLLSQKFPQSEAAAFAGLLCPKFNLSYNAQTLLTEVGRLHQNVIIVGYNGSLGTELTSNQVDALQQYSLFMLNCQTVGRPMGLAEFFEIMTYELRKIDELKWNYADEFDLLSTYIRDKELRQSKWPLKFNPTYWRLHMHEVRKGVFPIFLKHCTTNISVSARLDDVLRVVLGKKNSKMEKSLDLTLEALKVGDCGEDAVTPTLNKRAIDIVKTLESLDELGDDDQKFWCLEQFFLKTGWVMPVHAYGLYGSKHRMSTAGHVYTNLLLYSMVSSWVYLDCYKIDTASNCLQIPYDRPLRILSAFATTNGGANNMSTWQGFDGWIGDESMLRSLNKVSAHCKFWSLINYPYPILFLARD